MIAKILKGYLMAIIGSISILVYNTIVYRHDEKVIASWRDTIHEVKTKPWYRQIIIWIEFIIKLPIITLISLIEIVIKRITK